MASTANPFLTETRPALARRSTIPPRFRVSLALGARRPSRQTLRIALSALLPPAVILSLLLLLSLLGLKFNRTSANYGCDPTGNVWATASHRPNLWDSKYGFAISLGFGKFHYATVRAIDIAWDWLVARGVQLLATYLIWRVFKGFMALAIQRGEGIRYETIMKLQYDTVSIPSFVTYVKDLVRKKQSIQQIITALMLVLLAFYVLVAPTFVQAMTGYQPETIALLKLQNGTYFSFAELARNASAFQNTQHAAFLDGRSLSAAFLEANGYCAPQNTYVWGFSLILLFLFLCITFVFCAVIYGLWILHLKNTHREKDQSDRIFGDLKTAFTVVQSIQDELGAGLANEMNEKGLKNALSGNGGAVSLRRGWQGHGSVGSGRVYQRTGTDLSQLSQPSVRSKDEARVFWKEVGVSPTHSFNDKSHV